VKRYGCLKVKKGIKYDKVETEYGTAMKKIDRDGSE